MDLKGKSAIVTGAARGIGRGIALKLAAAGANIALVDLGNPADKALTYDLAAQTDLLKTAEEVKAIGVKAMFSPLTLVSSHLASLRISLKSNGIASWRLTPRGRSCAPRQ